MKLGYTLLILAPLLPACASLVTWDPPPKTESYNQKAALVRPERPVGKGEYMVRESDTVYSIAFRNNLDYREFARWNNIGPDYLIHPGQVRHLSRPPKVALVEGDIVSHPVIDTPSSVGTPIALPDESTGPVPVDGTDSPRPVPVAVAPPVSVPVKPAVTSESGGPYKWQWPTQGVVVRGFDLKNGSKGLDFKGELGQTVVAAAPGKVVYSGSALRGYGELVIVKHDDLRLSAYGYNRKRLVSEGQSVKGGQAIAELGLGPQNQPILHFEIRERGQPVNPVPYLPAK